MAVIIATIAAFLTAGLGAGLVTAPALAQTTVVPRTTITVDEQPMVVQPAPFGSAAPPVLTPTPDQRRRRNEQVQQQAPQTPVTAAAPARPRPQGPRRPSNGYSSFLTGPIDLTRPPVPQQ